MEWDDIIKIFLNDKKIESWFSHMKRRKQVVEYLLEEVEMDKKHSFILAYSPRSAKSVGLIEKFKEKTGAKPSYFTNAFDSINALTNIDYLYREFQDGEVEHIGNEVEFANDEYIMTFSVYNFKGVNRHQIELKTTRTFDQMKKLADAFPDIQVEMAMSFKEKFSLEGYDRQAILDGKVNVVEHLGAETIDYNFEGGSIDYSNVSIPVINSSDDDTLDYEPDVMHNLEINLTKYTPRIDEMFSRLEIDLRELR